MDALNVAYDETEKRSFVRLNLVALAFTLGAIVALMLALGAVVIAPIVLSQLGLSGASETLIGLLAAHCARAGGSGVDDALSLRSQPVRAAMDLAVPRECHRRNKLAHCRFPLRFDPGFPLRTDPA